MIRAWKYHGTGNDFLVVDEAAAGAIGDRRAFARAVCDRETGIDHPDAARAGADGVLFLAVEAGEPPRARMRLVQPDGSRAAMCGNGARCAARWTLARTADGVADPPTGAVVLDTPAGARHATAHPDGSVTVDMGRPSFAPGDVPLAGDRTAPLVEETVAGLSVTAVDTGVPHAVALVGDVDAVDLAAVAPAVRHADVFSEGANVTLASPDGRAGDGNAAGTDAENGDAPLAYRQRTFERGVEGETRSCGTGAVAVAAVARRLGAVGAGERVRVSPPGGTLTVTVDGTATLRGPVAVEFATRIDPARWRPAAAGAGE